MTEGKSFLSDINAPLVLKLLSEKDMYGYEMIRTLRKRSQNVFEYKAGMLYPLLHGLVGEGELDTYEQFCRGKMRKYYSISKEHKAKEE